MRAGWWILLVTACSSTSVTNDAGPDGGGVDAAVEAAADAQVLDAEPNDAGADDADATLEAAPDAPPPFDPSQLPGLALWLRSDLGVTLNGGVSAWADQSGNHNDFADDGTPPGLQSNAFNGLPAVEAANVRMIGKTNTVGTGAFVYEVVIGAIGNNQSLWFEQCGLGNVNQLNVYTPTSGPGISLGLMGQGKPAATLNSAKNVEDGAAHFIGVTRDANGTIGLRIDGTGQSNVPSENIDYQNMPGALISGGAILEEVFYVGALDAQQIDELESYFKSRYAL